MSQSNRERNRNRLDRGAVRAKSSFKTTLEILEGRDLPAVLALFSAASGTLSVFADNNDNSVVVSRNAAGQLLVNSGAVAIQGGAASVAITSLIQVFGQGGNDTISLNESNGALPRSLIFGGTGNDVITGGSGGDLLFGQAGNDSLLGKGGIDLLFGGTENDVLTGGDADDQAFGEAGNDRMIWNPGDDTDLNEGGTGDDTVEVNGGNGAEQFTVVANGTRVRFDRTNPAPFSLDIGTSENLVVNANGGADTFSAGNGLAALIQITVDGGAGDDTILGGDGADVLLGGDGNDLIDGNRGNDVALMGAGNDTFVWDPGDGSDVIEGQAGSDRMTFNGANVGERIDISANGGRVRFFRNVANITMDLNDVEGVTFNALGGSDLITVGDVSGTDLVDIVLDLAGTLGGGVGDGQADSIAINGTNGDDVIFISGNATETNVLGLAAVVKVKHFDLAIDSLNVSALAGDDVVEASATAATSIPLILSGGSGDDILLGGAGNDNLQGDDDDDVLLGGPGIDLLVGGAGDDIEIQG
ncbi:hypothetical protein EP7_001910 [Isosphaeraceae bacterium EP7]